MTFPKKKINSANKRGSAVILVSVRDKTLVQFAPYSENKDVNQACIFTAARHGLLFATMFV